MLPQDTRPRPSAPGQQSQPPRNVVRGRRLVEANARLTGATGAALLVLLAAEGVTLLRIGPLLNAHVFIGMMLIPPVVLKIGSTSYRFFRYYTGSPAYQEKGPPVWLLRLLGPFVVISTVTVLASGVALLYVSGAWRQHLLLVHKASFVLWFGVMALHVLGHALETARLTAADLYARTRRQIVGAGLRQWTVAAALGIGFLLGSLFVGRAGHFLLIHG